MAVLDEFKKLSPSVFYELANRKLLEDGIQIFLSQKISSISKINARTLEFEVFDRDVHYASLYVEKGKIAYSCSCRGLNETICSHAIGSCASLFAVLFSMGFSRNPVPPSYVEMLKDELDEIEKAELHIENEDSSVLQMLPAAHRGSINIEVAYPSVRIEVMPACDKALVRYLESLVGRFGKLPQAFELHCPHLTEFILYIYEFYENAFPINVLLGKLSITIASAKNPLPSCSQQLSLGVKGGKAMISLLTHDVKGDSLEKYIIFPDGGLLTPNGKLLMLEDSKVAYLFEDFRKSDNTIEDKNNKLVWYADDLRIFLDTAPAKVNHTLETSAIIYPDEVAIKDLPKLDVDNYRLEIVKDELGSYELTAYLENGEGLVSLTTKTFCVEAYLKSCRSWSHQLLASKPRRELLKTAIYDLFLLKRVSDRNKYIQTVVKDPLFTKTRLGTQARRYLYGFFDEWVDRKDFENGLIFRENAAMQWSRFKFPYAKFARLLYFFFYHDRDEGVFFDRKEIVSWTPDELTSNLPELFKLCSLSGIRLFLNGSELRKTSLSFNVDVNRGKRQDWFELKPEVKADGLVITEEQWAQILSGEVYFEGESGVRMIEISSVQTLQKLQGILDNQKKKANADDEDDFVTCNRLQILDWIGLQSSGVTINMPDEYKHVIQSLCEFDRVPAVKLTGVLEGVLRDYQKKGVEWLAFLYKHRFGACLADDMGLGKTIQVIAFLGLLKEGRVESLEDYIDESDKHLIVVPPSLIFNWVSEFKKFYPSVKVGEYMGNKRDLSVLKDNDVVVTTYDTVRRDERLFKEIHFHVVVFDEAQNLKNNNAARTKSANALNRKFTICLTGTPLENHVGEFYSIMNLAVPGILDDPERFKSNIKDGDTTLLDRAKVFMLRRTKGKILKELPPKVESNIYLNMGPAQREYYTRVVAEIRAEVMSAFKDRPRAQAGIIALAALTKIRQVCVTPRMLDPKYSEPEPKIEYLIDKLSELEKEGHAALVFSQFTRALDCLESKMIENKIPYVRMDGKTPVAKRKDIISSFQDEEKVPFFLISLKTGGVGLNLTRANYVFHLDPWWNPATENQASDRAHRIGQKNKVFIQRILMRGSVEEKMMELKKEKQALFDEIVESSGKTTGGGMITKDQINQLLGV